MGTPLVLVHVLIFADMRPGARLSVCCSGQFWPEKQTVGFELYRTWMLNLFSAETNYYKMWPCKCHLYHAGWGRANAWTVELWASQGSIPELQCLESENGALVLQHVNGGLLSYCVSLCEYDAWNCAVWSPAPASTALGPAAVSALLVLVPAAELTDGNWEQAWK